MQNEGVDWTDIGDVIAGGGDDDGKYTETEMQEVAQAARAEGVETGIKLGMARASNGSGNGQLTLPKPSEMAQYCHDRLSQLKDDKQRDFVGDMCVVTQRRTKLSPGRLAYLASVYIQSGGKALVTMATVLEVRQALADGGYLPIPTTGKVPPFARWQKIENVSHSMLKAWNRNWPRATQYRHSDQADADARRRYSQRACRDRDRRTGKRTV